MRFILASASPRRRELLKELIEEFEVLPSEFDETGVNATLPPWKLVKELAKGKAFAVADGLEEGDWTVLGSDTVVAFGKRTLGKPEDERRAKEMLRLLSGKKHAVYTGVCLVENRNGKRTVRVGVCKTAVYFQTLTEEFIDGYIESGSPMDKAGAYGIQDGGLVKKIKGSYTNVVGLPVELCGKMLKGRRGI